MTEKEFIIWLRGYVDGALPNIIQYSTGEQILHTIDEQLKSIDSEDSKLLLDSYDPEKTNVA